MKDFCTPLPENKKQYIKDIGTVLVNDYGKKDFYKPEDVKKANQKTSWGSSGTDFSCWSMSVFSSHEDFDAYHNSKGEVCDYVEMKQTMLEGISGNNFDFSFLEFTDSDINIDSSWLDLGEIFGAIGDFFSAFLD
ncbi:hypothetical protein NZ698_00695 [Chryseobacterium sp. PBS4-4]|uniref:DUF2750 domain-containing protein n=1 Tax=Chryseobacterium edaphi TaxID=2976532 RepID=A0ABT2W0C8_9FLAO|nr:hypothetical protein [Chryseobacterium edaphi]MCU7615699.1 hypothetical protein [Chryseobacterium edaphi]